MLLAIAAWWRAGARGAGAGAIGVAPTCDLERACVCARVDDVHGLVAFAALPLPVCVETEGVSLAHLGEEAPVHHAADLYG